MKVYKIEKGIRMPDNAKGYPFAKMEVNDSFFFEKEKLATVRSAAGAFAKRHSTETVPLGFKIWPYGDGYRCWRIK